MLSILSPILVFGLVIFVHELGHFLAAKAVGVYAPRFSIGFGPTLWRRRRGETEYVLAALPLGGYVRMASRHDEDVAFLEGGSEEGAAKKEDDPDYDPEALRPFGPHPVPEHRLFESKPLWARLIILIAGVTMNVILAFVVAIGLAFTAGRGVLPTRVVGVVDSLPGAPALMQLQSGDTIVRVSGAPVASWNDIVQRVHESRDSVSLTTNRGEIRVALRAPDAPATSGAPTPEQVARAIDYHRGPVLDSVIAGEPAALAGLRRGDSIISIDGRPVRESAELVRLVSAAPGRSVQLEIARDSLRRTVSVTPKPTKVTNPESLREETAGRIGIVFRADSVLREPIGVGRAMSVAAAYTWDRGTLVVTIVKRLVTGQISVRQLGGPIAITRASVEAAQSGIADLFGLIAFLSINVAVLNLLPIPILDGGQILLNVIESAKGSPFSMRTREYILRFGLLAIALLFVTVMYNDTREGLAKVFGWIARLFS
jgi:regulator of sigma E protease